MPDLYYCAWEDAKEVAIGDPVTEGKIAIGGTSAKTGAVLSASHGNKALYVRLFGDADGFVTWNADPTAKSDGTDGRPFASEQPEYHWIRADYDIAVIERT